MVWKQRTPPKNVTPLNTSYEEDPFTPKSNQTLDESFSFLDQLANNPNLLQLMKKGSYVVRFRGAASIFKYKLSPEGPREVGCFTRDDFLRLTNMHAFVHRGRNVIAALGFPDEIFLIDSNTMTFIKKIRVKDPGSWMHLYSKEPALIGTIAPSPDGEKLFVQTTRSFQIVDVATDACDYARTHFFSRICFNHMAAWRGET